MTILEVLLSPKLIFALAVYSVFSTSMLLIANRLQGHLVDVSVSLWIFEKLGIPLIRGFALSLFIVMTYPVLFGIAEAPAISALFDSGAGKMSSLVNMAFVVGILLPFIPLVGQLQFLALPIQGMAIAGLLFYWLQASTEDVELSPWPSWDSLLEIAFLAWLTHALAVRLTSPLGDFLDRNFYRRGYQSLSYQALILLFQAPVILVYTLNLGRQWPG